MLRYHSNQKNVKTAETNQANFSIYQVEFLNSEKFKLD